MLNGRSYFLGALYHTRGAFSNMQGFVATFANHLTSLPYERTPVLKVVHQLYEEYSQIKEPIGKQEAFNLLIAEDLKAVEHILENEAITQKIDECQQVERQLNNCRDEAVRLLHDLGVQVDTPAVFIEEQLPLPYTNMGYSALTTDQGDQEKYDISPGVHFPRNAIRPFYSEFLLVHELIHIVLGKHSPYLLARGLEEGLAELIGSMYLSSKILGKETTTNLFIYNRLGYGHNQFWDIYLDATRQATFLYHRFGLQGILTLLNEGREKIKEVERQCLHMEFDKIALPHGQTDPELSDLSDFLSLVFGRNLVVSPLAKYLCRYIHPNDRVSDILRWANVEPTVGQKAIKELQDRVVLLALSDDGEVVNWTDCDRLSDGSVIRYEIPETV